MVDAAGGMIACEALTAARQAAKAFAGFVGSVAVLSASGGLTGAVLAGAG